MKNKKAFTLIELLVVMAVAAILASLVIVSLGNARDAAQEAKVIAELAQLKKLVETEEANSHGGYGAVLTSLFGPGGDYEGMVDSYKPEEDSFCLQYGSYCIDSANSAGLGTCDEITGLCEFSEGGGGVGGGACSTESIGEECGGGLVASQEADYTLIAASTDYNPVNIYPWGCDGTTTGATSITNGVANTAAIVNNGCSTAGIAARLCYEDDTSGHTDWYLPARDELGTLYDNKDNIGGFVDYYYWSSTEDNINNDNAWDVSFDSIDNGIQSISSKSNSLLVRCVRRDE